MSASSASLAQQLSDADKAGKRLTSAALTEPTTPAEAFAVQRETLALNNWLTGGYKVAIRPDGSSVSAPMAHITHVSGSGTAGFDRPATVISESPDEESTQAIRAALVSGSKSDT